MEFKEWFRFHFKRGWKHHCLFFYIIKLIDKRLTILMKTRIKSEIGLALIIAYQLDISLFLTTIFDYFQHYLKINLSFFANLFKKIFEKISFLTFFLSFRVIAFCCLSMDFFILRNALNGCFNNFFNKKLLFKFAFLIN